MKDQLWVLLLFLSEGDFGREGSSKNCGTTCGCRPFLSSCRGKVRSKSLSPPRPGDCDGEITPPNFWARCLQTFQKIHSRSQDSRPLCFHLLNTIDGTASGVCYFSWVVSPDSRDPRIRRVYPVVIRWRLLPYQSRISPTVSPVPSD